MKVFSIIVLVFLLVHCGINKPVPLPDWPPLNVEDASKLRFDGLYNLYDTSKTTDGRLRRDIYMFGHYVVFSNKGTFHISSGSILDESLLLKFHSDTTINWGLGKYYIKGDTIYGVINELWVVRGSLFKKYNTYYQGIILNKDTIIDWKIVPPYPQVNEFANRDITRFNKRPKLHYFIKTEAVQKIFE